MPILGSLIAGLALPTQEHMEEAAKKTDDVPSSADRSVVALRSGSPFTLNHLGSLLQRTKKDTNSSELVDALKELDEMSKRHVEVLEHFVVSAHFVICPAECCQLICVLITRNRSCRTGLSFG